MKNNLHTLILITADFLALFVSFFLSVDLFIMAGGNDVALHNFLIVIIITLVLMYYEGIYKFRYDFWQDTLKMYRAFAISFLIVLSLTAMTDATSNCSPIFILLYFFLIAIIVPIEKRIIKKLLYKFDFFKKRILIIGENGAVDKLKKEISQNWYLGQTFDLLHYENVIIVSKGMNIDTLNETVFNHLQQNRELFVVPYITDINFAHSNILEYFKC